MQTTKFINYIAIAVISTSIFTSCSSNAEKEEAAVENVTDAKEELREVKREADAEAAQVANAEEWQAFKADAEAKINKNEERIVELKEKMKTSGKTMDSLYEKKISNLEEKNRKLKTKLDNYETSQSDWNSFKTEFNHDMDEMGQAFEDLTVDNK